MSAGWLRGAVLSSALVLWGQLVLIPTVVGAERVAFPLVIICSLLSLSGLVLGVRAAQRSQLREGTAYLLGLFPLGLVLFSLGIGLRPVARFDVPARVIASVTAIVYVFSCAGWVQELVPRSFVEAAVVESRGETAPRPRFHGAALGLIGVVGFVLAVIFPAFLAVRSPMGRAERLGGEGFAQARSALGTSVGLALGLAMIVSVGGELVRGRGPRRRGGTRGTAWLLWGLVLAVLVILLRKAR